jgi:hypothetical protein
MKTALHTPVVILMFSLAAVLRGDDQANPADNRASDRHNAKRPQMEREMESAAFLGVETEPASETLTDQLNLPRHFGLVVLDISPESPASAAMLKAHDILLKLDDQLLIDTYQLSVLIRNHREGDEITVTYLRGGKEATAKAKLILHPVPKLTSMSGEMPNWGRELAPEGFQGMLSMISPSAGSVAVAEDGPPETRIFKMNTGNSHVSYDDHDGALELTIVDGRQTLVAKDAKGLVLFSGPVDTPEQRRRVPAGVRERFEHLESQIKVDLSYKLDSELGDPNVKVEPLTPQSSLLRAPRVPPFPTLSLL